MKEPFRLLDLPEVVLCQVFRNGFNVVYLALCNSKCHKAVVDAKLKGCKVELYLKHHRKILCLTLPSYCYIWFDFQKELGNEEQQEDIENVKIGDHSFWIRNSDTAVHANRNSINVYTENIEQTIGKIKDLVKCLVKARYTFDLSLDEVHNFQQYFLQNVATEDCESVSIDRSGIFIRDRPPIPHDVMNLVLDNTSSNCSLTIMRKAQNDFKYEKSLNFEYLSILGADWFNAQNLFNTRVKVLRIYEAHQLRTFELKKFITRWTNGEYPEFRLLYISYSHRRNNWHKDRKTKQILYEGLDVTLWQCKRTMAFNFYCTLRPVMEMADFKRSDGIKATIGIGENEFVFTCDA